MAKKNTVDFTGAVPCFVCRTMDDAMPPFVAYPVCTRCTELSPIAVLQLPPDERQRYAVAIALNHVPDLAEIVTQSVTSTVKKFLNPGRGPARRKVRGSRRRR